MATVDLLLGIPQARTVIGVLSLDAAQNITHSSTAQVSKNPIESGSEVVDNIRLDNRTLQIEGLISSTPITLLGSVIGAFQAGAAEFLGEFAGGFGAVAGSVGAGIGASNLLSGGQGSAEDACGKSPTGSLNGIIESRDSTDVLFPEKAFRYLQQLRDRRVPFTVRTSLQCYPNMVITALTVPQNAEVGKSLRFQMTCEQIQIVNTQTVIIPERIVKRSGAAGDQNLGKQTGTEVEQPGATLLFSGFKSIGSAF